MKKLSRLFRRGKVPTDLKQAFGGIFALLTIFSSLSLFAYTSRPIHELNPQHALRAIGPTQLNTTRSKLANFAAPSSVPNGDHEISSRSKYNNYGMLDKVGSYRSLALQGNQRQVAVRNATMRVWDAYELHAFGYDEMKPISGRGEQVFGGGIGLTIVDSLGTLYIMGESDGRYKRARDWVEDRLDFEKVGTVSFFETTIRILGGLLSIYHLSGDEMYIRKAEDLGSRLALAFNTKNRYPCNAFSLKRRACSYATTKTAYIAEVGTNQLEFRALSHHSRSSLLHHARSLSENVISALQNIKSAPRTAGTLLPHPDDVLLPVSLSTDHNKFSSGQITFGGPGDSYFEYLIKIWVQGGKKEQRYWNTFAQVVDSAITHSVRTSPGGLTILADVTIGSDGKPSTRRSMQHLACFFPGSIILALDGLREDEGERRERWTALARNLTKTCYEMYIQTPSGLSGEVAYPGFGGPPPSGFSLTTGDYNIRPEAIEAMFYLYRHTKEEKYRSWAWTIFEAMEASSRTEIGAYAMVSQKGRQLDNRMPSFAIAETLKYLYLLFGDSDDLPLSKYVFNTEAHPLLITPWLAE